MSRIVGGILNFADRVAIETLDQRLTRANVVTSNIANAETPGFRAIGYSFEDQIQAITDANDPLAVKTSNDRHLKNQYATADGTVYPDVFVRPTESIPEDGNTVDVDAEMAALSKNQILYRSAVELLNRKLGVLRYAITSGGR